VIDAGLRQIAASDKAAGMLSMDPKVVQNCFDAGAQFVAVAADVLLLADAARATVKHWRK
jgi:4-hydroxy-2-oxoheptanedioate aldolase